MAALELADPALGDPVDRHGVDEMQLFAPLPPPGDKIGFFQDRQMLGDGLARHVEAVAQIAQRLAVPVVQPVQQLPAAGIGQGAKHSIVIHLYNT